MSGFSPSRTFSTSCRAWFTCRMNPLPIPSACRFISSPNWRATTALLSPRQEKERMSSFGAIEHWKQILNLIRWNEYPVPRAARKLGLLALSALGKSHSAAYELLWRASAGLPVVLGWSRMPSRNAKNWTLLSPRLRRRFRNQTSWQAIRPIHERFMQNAWENTPVKWMTYLDLNLRLPELLLMRLDKMGMGVSLETRVPFLDHKFVELAMSIPEQVITRGKRIKAYPEESRSGTYSR